MLKEMKAYAHLKPGQNRTKRLVDSTATDCSASAIDLMRPGA